MNCSTVELWLHIRWSVWKFSIFMFHAIPVYLFRTLIEYFNKIINCTKEYYCRINMLPNKSFASSCLVVKLNFDLVNDYRWWF